MPAGGLVTLGHIALDGTNRGQCVEAQGHELWADGTEEARLQAEVTALLQQAEAADAEG